MLQLIITIQGIVVTLAPVVVLFILAWVVRMAVKAPRGLSEMNVKFGLKPSISLRWHPPSSVEDPSSAEPERSRLRVVRGGRMPNPPTCRSDNGFTTKHGTESALNPTAVARDSRWLG